MLDAIRRVLGGGDEKEPTSDQIEDAIEAAEADLKRAGGRVIRLAEGYGDVLLEESDEAAEEHEKKIAAARREVARLNAAIPRLQEHLEEVRLAEREALEQAEVEQAEAARDEGIKLLRTLDEHWAAIVPILERLKEIDRQIQPFGGVKSPNDILRPFNKPIYESVLLPPLSEDGARWGGSAARWERPFSSPIRSTSTARYPDPSVVRDQKLVPGEMQVTISRPDSRR